GVGQRPHRGTAARRSVQVHVELHGTGPRAAHGPHHSVTPRDHARTLPERLRWGPWLRVWTRPSGCSTCSSPSGTRRAGSPRPTSPPPSTAPATQPPT